MKGVFSRTLTAAFLRKLSETLDELSSCGEPVADPGVVLLSGLALNIAASFARTPLPPMMAIAFGAFLSAVSGKLRAWLKATSFVAAFTTIVAAPAALQGALWEALMLLSRASGAASALIGALASLGWYQLLPALHRLKLPNVLTWELWVTLRMIAVLGRDAAAMLAAREAKLFTSSRRDALKVMGSTLGDLLLTGYRRARTLSMALAARTFAGSPVQSGCEARFDWRAMGLAVYTTLAIAFLVVGA